VSTLIRNGHIEADDYTPLADEDALPVSGRVILTLDRYRRDREALAALTVGVKLPNTADVLALWPELQALPLIALDFPGFADGRAYSQARLLSERLGFTGELRATGKAVVRDQFHFMLRCGFTSFVIRDDQDAEACLQALRDFSLVYQRAADEAAPVFLRRRASA
jgi:uncharacterized protein (DUF934 family)